MSSDIEPFVLRAELEHDDDVRGVSDFPILGGGVLTASLDKTCKLWSISGDKYECTKTFVGHTHTVFKAISNGEAIVSSSFDKTLIMWDWESGNPLNFLHGHEGPVSCCAMSPAGQVVSGSWDTTAIIWSPEGTPLHTLKGHSKNVLCVCWLSSDQILTGSGDRTIIMWSPNGTKGRTLTGHSDAVRAVKEVPGLGFLSSSNDTTLILWSMSGDQLQILSGEHTNLVYSCAVLSQDEYVSGSEDKTLRVWRQGQCVQTIPHPAMIWDVCVLDNGDVVTAGSDGKARVWTRRKELADEALMKKLQDTLANQEVNTKVVGGVDVTKLPGEDALLVPGTKDGEIKMIKRPGHPTAEVYSWSAYEDKWTKTGDLMDNPNDGATMGPQELNGVKYDFVFPVELNAGSGKFQLGYNRGENPFVAAQRFIWENAEQGIGQHFLDDIANFIAQNTDQMAQPQEQEAFSSEYAREAARLAADGGTAAIAPKEAYKQLEGQQVAYSSYMQEAMRLEEEERARAAGGAAPSAARSDAVYPAAQYTTFLQPLNVEGAAKKIKELNAEIAEAHPEAVLSEGDLSQLETMLQSAKDKAALADASIALLRKLLAWPNEKRFPAVDVLRFMASHESGAQQIADPENVDGFMPPLWSYFEGTASAPEQMLISRALANMFTTTSTLPLVVSAAAQVLASGKGAMKSKNNNARQAFAAVLHNFSICMAKDGGDVEVVAALCPVITEFLLYEVQAPVTLTLCAAAGTLMHIDSKVANAARDGCKKCFLKDCLSGKTQFGDPKVMSTAKSIIEDFFNE
jgi:phospholipase A-2-activating protein